MWLYVPSVSAVEFVGLTSGSMPDLRPQELEKFAQSCTSSGKCMQPKYWRKEWRKGSYPRLLSGLTSPQSEAQRSANTFGKSVASMLCSVESPVSRGALPGSKKGSTTSATYGLTSVDLSSLIVHVGFVSKMSLGSLFGTDLGESPQTYMDWVTEWRQSCSKLATLVQAITGSGYSLWQTPAVDQFSHRRQVGQTERTEELLPAQEANWQPSPQAPKTPHGSKSLKGTRGSDQALKKKWRTPKCPSGSGVESRQNGSLRKLEDQAEFWKTQERWRLNPTFAEWLMGWPHFWTLLCDTETIDLGLSEMELSRYRQELQSRCVFVLSNLNLGGNE